MKKFIAALSICGVALTGCDKKDVKPVTSDPSSAPVNGRARIKDATAQKLSEWKLDPGEVKAELAGTGKVVREKTATAGQQFAEESDNARLVTVINSKLVADPDLSDLKINVDVDRGVVTLKGAVRSVDSISRATLLALNTQGVRQVVSLLTLETKKQV